MKIPTLLRIVLYMVVLCGALECVALMMLLHRASLIDPHSVINGILAGVRELGKAWRGQ